MFFVIVYALISLYVNLISLGKLGYNSTHLLCNCSGAMKERGWMSQLAVELRKKNIHENVEIW